jgi:hypothetical protein
MAIVLDTPYEAAGALKDGIWSPLDTAIAPATGAVDVAIADASHFPDGTGETVSAHVLDQNNLLICKEVLYGWVKVGNILTGCSRLYDNRVLEEGDFVVLGLNSRIFGQIKTALEGLDTGKADYLTGTVNPSIGAGVAGTAGKTFYYDSATSTLYWKRGALATSWVAL